MLKLRVKVERIDGAGSVEVDAVANSGFVGSSPEVLLPDELVAKLKLGELVSPEPASKISGGGTVIPLVRYKRTVRVYLPCEDRVEGPVVSDVLSAGGAKLPLLNDKLLSRLKVCIVDAGDGLWCFRDELGSRIRRGV